MEAFEKPEITDDDRKRWLSNLYGFKKTIEGKSLPQNMDKPPLIEVWYAVSWLNERLIEREMDEKTRMKVCDSIGKKLGKDAILRRKDPWPVVVGAIEDE